MTDPYNPNWKQGDIIRHISTGRPMLVIQTISRLATIAVDLQNKQTPSVPLVILFRDYQHWAMDVDMDCLIKKNEIEGWKYNPVRL